MTAATKEEQIRAYYHALYEAWGPQHWWPARTRLEVIVGAYLTQNTSWKNVEIALRRLRAADRLSLAALRTLPRKQLEVIIRPAGYFRQKAARLKIFIAFVDQCYGGSLQRLFAQPTEKLRQELLSLNGVGPETADSILLYAG
jgi:endonuclease-3 related protein